MIKQLLILISAAILTSNSSVAQTYNFESWTGNEPNGWESTNVITTQGGGAVTVSKETTSPGQGSASVKMQTGSCPSCPTFSILGPFGPATPLPDPMGGIISLDAPISQRPLSVDFKYKAQPAGNDAGGFSVTLTKYNPATDESETIGEGYFEAGVQTTNWTNMNIPIIYYSSLIPDTISFWAGSSIGSYPDLTSLGLPPLPFSPPTPVNGSTFYIDAINVNMPSCASFSISVTGTNETSFGAMDGTASVSPSGGTQPYTYQWSNFETTSSINGLIPALYSVTVTDGNGCVKVGNYNVLPFSCAGFTVTVTGVQASSFTAEDGSATAVASGIPGPYTYQWNNGETTASITGLRLGAYAVAVTASGGNCITWGYFPSNTSDIRNVDIDNSVVVFPNPSEGVFTLTSEKNYQFLTITNMLGEVVYYSELSNLKNEIDLRNQSKGVYFLKMTDKQNRTTTKKVILQ